MRRKSLDSVKIYSPRFRKEEIIRILKKKAYILAKKMGVKKIILFGSYARNRYTAASDIDILIIYNDKERRSNLYSEIWDIIDIPEIQLHIYTLEDYIKMKRQDNPFIKDIEKHGIIIWEEDR